MTEDELNKIVEAKLADALAARLEADRARVRDEVVTELRRAEERAWYDRINKKHPIEDKYGGLGKAGHEARLKAMSAAAAKTNAEMDAANARPVEGSLLEQRSRAALTPGSEGLEIRSDPGWRS
jgi:hypothetical protein